ncbi:arsinothricin resistance N-acetyltransferase ArsN1 family B [Mangrovitalea sediminis]|uniref:arsinothricin resistance N-acetyltransferase ArsN1 family B n=1 Tax=Mangrovitalea sediminis TaxID=1982043 RepID=UPI000BE5A638|nr:arsinothricin resistance N-acetyltransferase ArsN1 family B [Mangrovitalea sediminis]
MTPTLREAAPDDAAAICELYNPYVLNTAITFEVEPVTPEEMAQRIASVTTTLPWLVCYEGRQLLGYAYATPWRPRAAYRHSVESSIYLAEGASGRGLGTRLYGALFDALRQRPVHAVFGGITLPNAGSVALHEKMGFRKVGHLQEVGWKFDRWIDVGYWQLLL